LGFCFHHQLNFIMEFIRELGTVGLLLIVALAAIYVTYGVARHHRPVSKIAKISGSRPKAQNPSPAES
jgi:hypothetical protein